MTTIILLIVGAAVLAGLELFIPGGILGVVATLMVIAACALSFADYGMNTGLLTVLGAVVFIAIALYIEVRLLAKSGYAKRIFLSASVQGKVNDEARQGLLGKDAKAISTLAPTGAIEVEGKQYEGFSQDGHVNRGERLRVVRVEEMRLVVERQK